MFKKLTSLMVLCTIFFLIRRKTPDRMLKCQGHSRFSPFLRIILLVGFLFASTNASWAAINTEPEFVDGNTWTYLENGVDYVTKTVLPGTVYINGVQTKVIKTSEGKCSGCKAYLSEDANGFYFHRSFEPNIDIDGGEADMTITLSPPMKINKTVNVGDIINGTGTLSMTLSGLGTYNLTYSYTFKIIGFENITVPLGNFDTVKTELQFTFSGTINGEYLSETYTETSWNVKNIGDVKSVEIEDGIETVSELYSTNIDLDVTSDNLTAGWNLLSLYIVPLDPTIDSILSGIKEDIISAWKWNNGNWVVRLPNYPDGGKEFAAIKGFSWLIEIGCGEGFWVNCGTAQTLIVSGTQPSDTSCFLTEGWNLIGLKSNETKSITDLISGNEGNIASVWKWEGGKWAVYLPGEDDGGAAYAQGKGFSLLEQINPGEGFWVNCTELIILN